MAVVEILLEYFDPGTMLTVAFMWYHLNYRLKRIRKDHDRVAGVVRENH